MNENEPGYTNYLQVAQQLSDFAFTHLTQEQLQKNRDEAVNKIDREIQDEKFRAEANPTMHSTLCQISRIVYGKLEGAFSHLDLIHAVDRLRTRAEKAEEVVAKQAGEIHRLREEAVRSQVRKDTLTLINRMSEVA